MSDGHPGLAEAVRLLRAGALVAFPTETVYGLGADATAPEAVARIFAAKARPNFNPLIAHVATLDEAAAEGRFTREAERLATRFWPGPLTLVLPRAPRGAVCDLACAGLSSVGLRVPDHPLALALLRAVRRPLAAPSANLSGRLSPTSADDVRSDFADTFVLDAGPSRIGVESTIVGCLDNRVALLRPGGISREEIEATAGRLDAAPDGITAPGMLVSHYAPNARLRLDADELLPAEAGLGFGGALPRAALDLSPRGDVREAAANLYRHLRQLDAQNPGVIAVARVPNIGLGAAINDRLRRAAAPRPNRAI